MNNETKSIKIENPLSVDKQRNLLELTSALARALTEEEFLQIINIYNETINRLLSLEKEKK